MQIKKKKEELSEPIRERLKQIRKESGLSLAKFASKIGISAGYVGDWESGKTMPSIAVLVSIAKEFNISLDWLLTGQASSPFDYEPPSLSKWIESLDITNPNDRAMQNLYNEFVQDRDIEELNTAIKLMNKSERTELMRQASLILQKMTYDQSRDQLKQSIEYKIKSKEAEQSTAAHQELKEKEAEYVPIVGASAAGVPITAISFVDGYIPVDIQYKDCFAVRVRGDSMVGAGIPDGGFVIVRRQPQVENGEIALVMLDGDVTIKKFVLEEGKGILISANHKYKPIYVDSGNDVKILGKVVKAIAYDDIKDEIKEDLSFLSR